MIFDRDLAAHFAANSLPKLVRPRGTAAPVAEAPAALAPPLAGTPAAVVWSMTGPDNWRPFH
jgi:hypothetical protein